MQLEDIYEFFENYRLHLKKEQAVCYVLAVLLEEESYQTEIIRRLEEDYPNCRLSDLTLHRALQFLEDSRIVTKRQEMVNEKGRPCKVYRINPAHRAEAQTLANLWLESNQAN